ncbi:MAG: MarC family protein [Desulfurococcales archaeon]|nr:MarC family protein [Desulfurococcales archaeon]
MDYTPFIMLFIVLDPIGITPYYQAIISRLPRDERTRVLRKALAAALSMLLAFTILGDYLFKLLDVGIGDFQIAAGIILLIYAVSSIFEIQIGMPRSSESVAIFPLATPLLAGPGAITTLIYIKYRYGIVTAVASSVVNILVAYPILAASTLLLRVLGRHGSLFIDKFMSMVLAGFAVSIIRDGIAGTI